MGEIVNLRRARKQRERRREEAVAEQNRVVFGRSKAERRLIERERAMAEANLEARRIAAPRCRVTPSNTRVVKHSLVIAGHRTSVSIEDAFWRRLRRIAAERGLSVNALAATVDASRGDANLSSAIRVFVLEAESASCFEAALDGRSRRSP